MRRTVSVFAFLLILPALAAGPVAQKGRVLEPKEYDRLDGHGATAKKVDVIEWENNLEIHVYPKQSLKSLGMKIDRTKKDKPVMVIEYAFNGVPYTLIRRALLSIPMKDGFKTYRDTSTTDYDKIIISNNTLNSGVEIFALASEPVQLYPDYHPALGEADAPKLADTPVEEPAKTYGRKSASEFPSSGTPAGTSGSATSPARIQFKSAEEVEQDSRGTARKRNFVPSTIDEDGGIKHFAF